MMVQPGPPIDGPLAVGVECVCKRPAKPARGYPMGDVDNYAKGILDAATKAGVGSMTCKLYRYLLPSATQ